jgi:hypothetical protein
MLLLIALLALVLSCLVLVLELAQYEFQIKPPTNLRSATPVTAVGVLLV